MNQIARKLMKIVRIFTTFAEDVIERLYQCKLRLREILKFKDSRRVAIYSKVNLTAEQKKQIDDFYRANYGKKISHTWHKYYTAFTGNFDANYFPELIYASEFEHYLHCNEAYCKVFSDKNVLPYLAQAAGVKTAKTLFSCVGGLLRNEHNEPLTAAAFEMQFGSVGEAFVKPSVDSNSGDGCRVVNMQQGKDVLSGQTVAQLIKSLGKNFIVQERLRSHPAVAALYPHSVNTFRIVTYRWKDEILHARLLMKIGRGGKNVENAHAGGIFVAVEDDGTLHKTAFSEFNTQFLQHPDTHITFEGYKIPHMDKLIEAAFKMHALLPQVGIFHWDFILNEQGIPVIMEGNTGTGGIGSIQMAHGKGLFGDKTGEILRWTAQMKKLPFSKRKQYRPGDFK